MASVTRDHSNHDLRAFARQIIKGSEEFLSITPEELGPLQTVMESSP
jgi:hypothetical protein